mgnify:FL=1
MVVWRLLVGEGDAYWNMALDEALLELKRRGLTRSTLRLYVFKPSAVTIGYFQKIEDSVDLEYAARHGIPVVRRATGGGSVYHDEKGEVTYAVISEVGEVPADIQECYEYICTGLVYALEKLGLKAEFVPINDIVVRGKKISGSAQLRRGRAVLQHGTLMYNTDLETLARVLKVPKEKLREKGISSIYERVTTVSRELGRPVSREEVIDAMIEGFSRALGVELKRGELTSEEIALTRELESKYRSREWNFKR